MTKVEYVSDAKYTYQVHTLRGIIHTSNVVYCTNGFAGHLLPELRGRLYPYRGTMTVQDIKRPIRDPEVSWNFQHKPLYDPETKSIKTGLYYLQQNPLSGYFFIGGELQTAETCLLSDDTDLSAISVQNLQQTLTKIFNEKSDSQLISSWSGIMGFTADYLPLVGKLPATVTKRDGDGEWIGAGFNGMGMCMCWRSGEAIAKKIYGIDVSDWLPEAYEVSEERLNTTLTVEHSVEKMDYLLLHKETINS
jgi:glycine/D-amino acid oxidase-like deaminating enzyme